MGRSTRSRLLLEALETRDLPSGFGVIGGAYEPSARVMVVANEQVRKYFTDSGFEVVRDIYLECKSWTAIAEVTTDVLRDKLIALDCEVLGESTRLFSNARNTARRLESYNGLSAEPLYHPPPLADQLKPGPFGEGSANFAVLKEWNKSPVYQKTIAVFAAQLMGEE